MQEMVRKKMLALREGLLAAYRDSQDYPSPVSGREREIFLHNLLDEVLPAHFRVGSGVITDRYSSTTGQIDLVVELPVSLSFPVVGENRLYFADTVGAAIEVKSDLSKQWAEAEKKLIEVNGLVNQARPKKGEFAVWSNYQVPFFVVAYRGPKTIKTVEKKFRPREIFPPAGVYIIESNIFIGYRDGWLTAKGAEHAMLAFITALYDAVSKQEQRPLDLLAYS
ncbi:MAG: DUF6602 domain-containing protein [Sphingopyxis sp.]|uniref:DUF6602 domain-containing protein n=1 Tax=Sphingopyxis sp. TaxID=1908224 RepID=UPI002AB98D80|nr:DUF6602 domain-containing protein [Sphingopyxis sp.]MDZ3831943.1 DUF6602 domain-containing protein [Sphingopyxis sp.]